MISPLAETVGSLILLARDAAAHPGEHRWLAAHRAGYRARLAADPVASALVAAALGNRRWIADFLAPPPDDAALPDFQAELAGVRATPAASVLADLRVAIGGPTPDLLDRADLGGCMADLLDWVWRRTVQPSWPHRLCLLEADIASRTRRLGKAGWASALDEMRPGMRWLGDGRLQINAYDYPPRDLSGAELLFVPITPRTGWAAWDEPGRYAVVYPCSAPLADAGRSSGQASLAGLMGPGRARILALLEAPLSTTQLVALTGLGLGSVGRHVKILLDAGLTQRRRVGRSVLYYRTDAGDTAMEAAGVPPRSPEPA